MGRVYVTGHRHADTDSIAATMLLAGLDAVRARGGVLDLPRLMSRKQPVAPKVLAAPAG